MLTHIKQYRLKTFNVFSHVNGNKIKVDETFVCFSQYRITRGIFMQFATKSRTLHAILFETLSPYEVLHFDFRLAPLAPARVYKLETGR